MRAAHLTHVVFIAIAAVLACGEQRPDRIGASVRDSLGIRIVENATPAWTESTEWRRSPDPVVVIGSGAADSEDLFQVVGALRLADGRIVIANSGTDELRFYGPDGRLLSSVGGEGAGPGEFDRLFGLYRYPGDSLLAYDLRHRRVSLFDERGTFARTMLLTFEAAGYRPTRLMNVFGDGEFLIEANLSDGSDPPTGFRRADLNAFRVTRDLTDAHRLGPFPGAEGFAQSLDINGQPGMLFLEIPFARTTTLTVFRRSLYVATNDTYEISVLGIDGSVRAIIRRQFPLAPVGAADVELLRDARLERIDNETMRGQFRDAYDDMPRPETFPAYSEVRVDTEGNLWVRSFNRPGSERVVWSVFDADGRWLGDLEFPLRFDILDIGADYVLGRWRDDLDVEHVWLFELGKG